MLPDVFFQIMSIIADLVLFLFVGHYLIQLRTREKEMEKKEKKIDGDYHLVVDDALAKERKILEDATQEADQIIAETHTVTEGSKDAIDKALESLQEDIKKDMQEMTHSYRHRYQNSLKQVTDNSLKDFKSVTHELQDGLKKQVTDFQKSVLPGLQKELDEYKQGKMKEADQRVHQVVQKVAQEVLNKSLSLEDHQKLIIDALEKAKREGIIE